MGTTSPSAVLSDQPDITPSESVPECDLKDSDFEDLPSAFSGASRKPDDNSCQPAASSATGTSLGESRMEDLPSALGGVVHDQSGDGNIPSAFGGHSDEPCASEDVPSAFGVPSDEACASEDRPSAFDASSNQMCAVEDTCAAFGDTAIELSAPESGNLRSAFEISSLESASTSSIMPLTGSDSRQDASLSMIEQSLPKASPSSHSRNASHDVPDTGPLEHPGVSFEASPVSSFEVRRALTERHDETSQSTKQSPDDGALLAPEL